MDTEASKKVLASWASGRAEIKKVYVYGSRVKDTFKEGSDLDVAIELDFTEIPGVDQSGGYATWLGKKQIWQVELAPMFPFPVHLQWCHPSETEVMRGIEESGQLVYSKAT